MAFVIVGASAHDLRLRMRDRTEQEKLEFRSRYGEEDRQDRWFDQKLDHFDPANNVTWKQRYWKVTEHSQPDGPHFLCIGGEDDETDAGACVYAIFEYAQELNATVWTLEHRFYGASQPFPDLSTENLRYLSSAQAVEDLAYFIRVQNEKANITDPKWVLFGGSYPGSLALWARQLHPGLTVGAVGSSAPMEPIVDFYEYAQVAEEAYRRVDPECPQRFREAFVEFEKNLYSSDGRARIREVLGAELGNETFSYKQIQSLFVYLVYGLSTR
ncbi:serine protease F56F10.1 [Aphelenchoides avenae]|nr:serine protease F56F10.1 [Aphelenchus avenae]